MLALLVLAVAVCVPFLVLIYLCAKFENLKNKMEKSNFNTLLLKVDKEDRWRIFLPCFYFLRRFATAIMLVLGSQDKSPAYLQFAMVIMMSAILMFYLAKEEPYVQRKLNYYVFSMELIYFLLGMSIFSFTDATADIGLKTAVAIVCIVLLCLFFFSNIVTSCLFACKGRAALR